MLVVIFLHKAQLQRCKLPFWPQKVGIIVRSFLAEVLRLTRHPQGPGSAPVPRGWGSALCGSCFLCFSALSEWGLVVSLLGAPIP